MFKKVPTLLFAISAVLSISLAEASSSPELICHTKNKSECYPKLFEATPNFEKVHDDQDIPPGLHVRLNIQTGLKEAKLYDGNDDDLANTIEVHSDAPIPDAPIPDPSDPNPDSLHAIDAPPADYSPATKIPIPPELYQHILHGGDRTIKKPFGSDADADAFHAAISALSSESDASALLPALATLEDLAHDIYWGLSLSQSTPAITSLSQLLLSDEVEVSSAAALVLGNTVHNNPKALQGSLTHAPELPSQVREILFRSDPDKGCSAVEEHSNPRCRTPSYPLPARQYTRLLFLLSSLLSDPEAPRTWANGDGMYGMLESGDFEVLLEHFYPREVLDTMWERPRQAIADFVLDRIAGSDVTKRFAEAEEGGGRDKPDDGPVRRRKVWERTRSILVGSCRTFETAIKMWDSYHGAREGMERSTAFEHTLLAQDEVLARLKEIGCEGCYCEERVRDEL